MILFGRKDKHLATHKLPKEICEKCGKRGGVVSIFQIYFHVFLLPIIPFTRRTASQCLHCNDIKVEKNFSETQKKESDEMKSTYKTPLWTMVGGIIMLVGMIIKLYLKWS